MSDNHGTRLGRAEPGWPLIVERTSTVSPGAGGPECMDITERQGL